jgi:AGZA family xanthine/uracil permease-like MFS transporter
MRSVVDFFKIHERKSSIRIEVLAGITTFMTMSYIIFLQPLILSGKLSGTSTGMDIAPLTVGVCLAAAFGSLLMGVLANYPVALAPGMGENFFFVSLVGICVSMKIAPPETAWQTALGVVFISGILFLFLSFLNIRGVIINSISPSLKHALAAGIGLFIALLGLKNAHVIKVVNDNFILNISVLNSFEGLIFFSGLLITAVLFLINWRGAVLIGIVSSTIIALLAGCIEFNGIFSTPPSISPIFAKIDIPSVLNNMVKLLPFIIIFTFMDIFDTIGTLVGVATQGNLLKDGKLPDQKKAFAADSIATIAGVFVGQSTVTSYIESAVGVKSGGRTGLTALVVALCFVVAVFFTPLFIMIGTFPPITAPALVFVGALMMQSVSKIEWDDIGEALPAFLIIIGIPLFGSIADGLMFGFVFYPLINLFAGRAKKIGWLTYFIAGIMCFYLIVVRTGLLKSFI